MAMTDQSPPTGAEASGVAVQIPRNTLALLMVAQFVVVIPFLFHLSPWIIAVGLFCGYWRTLVYLGRWDYPHRYVTALLVAASLIGVVASGVQVFSLESAATLLILAFALKLIEMKSRRDAYLVFFLSYFVIATQFLFNWSISMAAYELVAVIMVTAAMVGLNQWHTRVRPLASLKLATALVAQALPLTVILFLLFPRIAPLWTVPLPSATTTGISDTVTPGDVAKLTQSDNLAFRVVFDGRIPPPTELYWRGLVYSTFADGTWSVGAELPPVSRAPAPLPDGYLSYEVLLEPTMRDWLFAMDTARPEEGAVYRTADHRLQARDPVLSVFRYKVRSYPNLAMDLTLPDGVRSRELALEDSGNPRTRAFAAELHAASGSHRQFIGAVLAYVRNETYTYTLSPPTLARTDSIDEFWFDSRRGFCTHYAGALVYMLRSVGIPARMVGGYQGGELNPITNHLVVRQYDAHAWVEAWLEGEGWVRVDPTAAVAPERVEQGLSAALSASDRATLALLSSVRMGEGKLFSSMLRWADSMEHRWNLWVIGYDNRFQSGVLKRLLGELTPTRIGVALLIGGGLSVGMVAVSLFWRRRPLPRHPVERIFTRFAASFRSLGLARRPEESPGAYIARIASDRGIDDARIAELVMQLNTLLYNPAIAVTTSELRQLRGQLRWLQLRLAFTGRS